MSAQISLSLPIIFIFLLGMLFAIIGTLDELKITHISQRMKTQPVFWLLMAIGIIASPILAKLGNTVSTTVGDVLLLVSFLFFYFAAFKSFRSGKNGT